MVLIKENNLPPSKLALGRVIESQPGMNNQVRVVKIRTAKGITKRTTAKLCPLPINEEN